MAALVPLLLFAIAMIGLVVHERREARERGMLDTVRAVSALVDTELERSLAALDVLALSEHLTRGELAAFQREARRVAATQPMWTNVMLVGPHAEHLVSACVPYGTPLPPVRNPAPILETVRRRRAVITGHLLGMVVGRPVVEVTAPVIRDGDVKYVVEAVIESKAWEDLLARYAPRDTFGTLIDRRGVLIARTVEGARFVGTVTAPDMRNALAHARDGSVKGVTSDGSLAYGFFHTSALSGWTTVLTVPAAVIDAPVRRTLELAVGGFTVLLLIGAATALGVGRWIGVSIAGLGRSVRALGAGARPVPMNSRIVEVAEADAALAAAYALLDARCASEQAARAELEAASRAKDQFMAMLGHELRNPLGAIFSAAAVLEHAGHPDERATRSRDIVVRQVRHLARLVDDLLDLGRVTAGKIALDRRPIDVAAAVGAFVDTARSAGLFSRHHVTLVADPVWVNADPARLEQMVTNLVGNALKFTPPDGHVRVDVRRDGEDAVIAVDDDGAGIAAEVLPNVFDLFVQAEQGPHRALGGLGIGLTLVHRLAELHGGRVEAASDGPGRGSRFTIRLPAIPAPDGDDVAPTSSAATASPRVVLVVEDNGDARQALADMLRLAGHEVYEAEDGAHAIALVTTRRPDIVLLDIGLPDMTGYEVAGRLHALANGRDLRIVALTGYGQAEDRRRAMSAGFDGHLVKPVDPDVLVRVIAASFRGDAASYRAEPSSSRTS